MIFALAAIGLPLVILSWFLIECWQHQRRLNRAETDLTRPDSDDPQRKN